MIYLDNNATTPVRPEVVAALMPYLEAEFGNPNSSYFLGQKARKAVERAREQVAALTGAADAHEIVFTSCGSESDVMAITGAAWAAWEKDGGRKPVHVLSSAVEHHAVKGILSVLARRGFSTSLAAADGHGLVSAQAVAAALKPETAVASVMLANNEVGTIQPIAEMAALCRARGVLFHTDAVQAAGKVPVDVRALGVDMLSLSGHKLGAPKGVGALYIRKGLRLSPVITGNQEKNRRGGTENVAAIVGFGMACELAKKELERGLSYAAWRDELAAAVAVIPDSRLNGHPTFRLPHCAHFSFRGLDGHNLVIALDQKGFCLSSGPACSSGASEPSHVLTAMGIDREWAVGSLRVSFGWANQPEDGRLLAAALPGIISQLRKAVAA